MSHSRWLSFLATLVLAVPLVAAEAPSEFLRQDAATYAEQFGVGIEEAIRRLQLQRAAGDLDAALTAEEPETFAGLWIEHAPRYRMVARFTDRAAEARLKTRIAGGPFAGLVETRSARWSLVQLEGKQAELRERLKKAGEEYESELNVFENRIELYTTDPVRTKRKLAAARTSLPDGVRVERVGRIAGRQALVGGTPGTNCTFGFAVIAASGELGISTAGHCPNPQAYLGTSLPFRANIDGGDYDVQWNSTCDRVDVTNQIDSGIGLRPIHSTRSRAQQVIGTFLCKMGRTTGRTCGTISSKNFDLGPDHNATFIRVEGGYNNLSEVGDSGAPWFVEDVAHGLHSAEPGSDGNDAVYVAVNYLSGIGVSVLTYDPGPGCNLPPVASFTYSNTAMQYHFDATSSHDPDGSIVSYFWNFGDGTTATTGPGTPFVSHVFDGGTYTVTLTVTDHEGRTGATSMEITTCGGPWQPVCFE